MNNKKGFSYILVCVIILVVCSLLAVGIYYASVFHLVRQEKERNSVILDSVVTKYATENYDALKQGVAFKNIIDRQTLVNRSYTELGFNNATTLTLKKTNGKTEYTVTRPVVTATLGNTFGVEVSYSIKIPFELFGKKFTDITVPIRIESRFTQK